MSEKNWLTTLLLCFFLGTLGIHHFYAGRTGIGITQLILTLVGWLTSVLIIGFIPLAVVGIWVLIDFIMIIVGNFKDKDGKLIKNN